MTMGDHVLDGLLNVMAGLMLLRVAGWCLTTELSSLQGDVDDVVRTVVPVLRYVGWVVLWGTVFRLTLGVVHVAVAS